MVRTGLLALSVALLPQGTVSVQAAWQFRFQPGQVLSYRVKQDTSATEVIDGTKTTTRTQVRLVKQWRVLGPETGKPGIKMALSLASLSIETTKPNGDNLVFDSAHLEKSTPEMRKQLAKLIGQTIAVVRIDRTGKVLEVIESKHGPASRFESEPPFRVVLPNGEGDAGTKWTRNYCITLDPPQGTGEKFDATQHYTCKAIPNGTAMIHMTTTITKMPENLLDQVPLLQAQQEGEIYFRVATGQYRGARLRIDKELKNHRGKGSSYRFQSIYTENYVGDK
jgi:hypothetical protein